MATTVQYLFAQEIKKNPKRKDALISFIIYSYKDSYERTVNKKITPKK